MLSWYHFVFSDYKKKNMSSTAEVDVDVEGEPVEEVVEVKKRKRGAAKPRAAKKDKDEKNEKKEKKEKAEKKPPKPKEISKLTNLYLGKVAPAITKQKKEREVKFNLRLIDEYVADENISKQQFLALLHFIDQSSLIVDEFEFRQDVPWAITSAGLQKVMRMAKEIKECKDTIPEGLADRLGVLEARFSVDAYKLPAKDRSVILKCQAKGNGCVRVILEKTTLEQFVDQRSKNESIPSNKSPKTIRFLGAQFRYEPVFDVVFDDAEEKPKKRRKKSSDDQSPPPPTVDAPNEVVENVDAIMEEPQQAPSPSLSEEVSEDEGDDAEVQFQNKKE